MVVHRGVGRFKQRLRSRSAEVQAQLGEASIGHPARMLRGSHSSNFAFVIGPTEMATLKTVADAASLFNVHRVTVSRLLANVHAEVIGVNV